MLSKQKKNLRALAHELKPIVITGQAGVTDPVINEINIALDHHELIKVRVRSDDRESRKEMISTICDQTGADLVQTLGQIITLYRKKPEQPSPKKK